jgi:hypothetical protein
MRLKYIDFLKKLLIYSLILGTIMAVAAYYLPARFISPALPFLFIFFFSVTLIVHLILLNVTQKKSGGFVNLFMLLTFGKLLFFLTIILVYSLLNRSDAVRFIISFFILYIFYTAFEVVLSLSHTKVKKDETV